MPKVSVIIPTYNRAGYIVKTLESVFAQTYTDYEVIVVDDGSTDDTEEVLKPYYDRIIYIRKENGGQGSARNVGIKLAKGEYVAFLDSDDLWLPEKLEIQVKFMDDNPEVGLVFSDFVVFYEDDTGCLIEMRKVHLQGKELTFQSLFHRNFIPTLTVLVRKSCIDDVGLFDESRELIVGEDYEMWLRIAMRYRLAHVPEVLAKYRHHDNNIVGTDLEKNYAMHLKVIHKFLAVHPGMPEKYRIDMDAYYRDYYYCSGRNLYQNKRYQPAVKYLRQALGYKAITPKALILYLLGRIRLMSHGYSG